MRLQGTNPYPTLNWVKIRVRLYLKKCTLLKWLEMLGFERKVNIYLLSLKTCKIPVKSVLKLLPLNWFLHLSCQIQAKILLPLFPLWLKLHARSPALLLRQSLSVVSSQGWTTAPRVRLFYLGIVGSASAKFSWHRMENHAPESDMRVAKQNSAGLAHKDDRFVYNSSTRLTVLYEVCFILHNHTIAEISVDLWRPSDLSPWSSMEHPAQGAQGHIHKCRTLLSGQKGMELHMQAKYQIHWRVLTGMKCLNLKCF